jgi:cytochrome c-550 PedF
MMQQYKVWMSAVAVSGVLGLSMSLSHAHGNVTPQPVDVKGLPKLSGPLTVNPYRDTPNQDAAVKIGSSAFNQNCARCHGLEAVSGGIAPDLRHLPKGKDGDEYFQMRIRNGSIRNGVTYMPSFSDVFSEEAVWAIRSYLDSRYEEQ